MMSQPVQQCHPAVFTLRCPCVCVCVFSLTGLSVVLHTAAVAPVWVGRGAIATNAGFHQAEKGPEWNKNDLAQYAPSFLSLFFSFQLGWCVFSGSNNADLLVHYAFNAIMYPPKSVAIIFCGRTRPFSALKDEWPWFRMILDCKVRQQEAILGSARIVPNLTMEGGVSHTRFKNKTNPEQRGLDLPVKTSRCSSSFVSQI